MKTQPMETAPKDGTDILLLYQDQGWIQAHWWSPPAHLSHMKAEWKPIWLDEHGCGCCGDASDVAIAWAPLPSS